VDIMWVVLLSSGVEAARSLKKSMFLRVLKLG